MGNGAGTAEGHGNRNCNPSSLEPYIIYIKIYQAMAMAMAMGHGPWPMAHGLGQLLGPVAAVQAKYLLSLPESSWALLLLRPLLTNQFI